MGGGLADKPAPWPGGCSCSPGPWPSPVAREPEWWGPQTGQGGDGDGPLEQEGPSPLPVGLPEEMLDRWCKFAQSSLPCSTHVKKLSFPFFLPLTSLYC